MSPFDYWKGKLIIFEGISGSGKTTVMRRLTTDLEAAGHNVQVVREPGGTYFGDKIREMLLFDKPGYGGPLIPLAQLFLFCAARAQLYNEVIVPALKEGRTVLADRSWFSSLAYQHGGNGLAWDVVFNVCAAAIPDVTATVFILQLPVEVAQKRMAARDGNDAFDTQPVEYHQRVHQIYANLSSLYPGISDIDASGDAPITYFRLLETMNRLARTRP